MTVCHPTQGGTQAPPAPAVKNQSEPELKGLCVKQTNAPRAQAPREIKLACLTFKWGLQTLWGQREGPGMGEP